MTYTKRIVLLVLLLVLVGVAGVVVCSDPTMHRNPFSHGSMRQDVGALGSGAKQGAIDAANQARVAADAAAQAAAVAASKARAAADAALQAAKEIPHQAEKSLSP